MTNAATIVEYLKADFGQSVLMRERRPDLFQVSLPAYLRDGDAAIMFVRTHGDKLVLTDLGHTLMRISYRRPITDPVEAALDTLARNHGFNLEVNGEIAAVLAPPSLVAGALGLVQVQSEADATISMAIERGERAEAFKHAVVDALKAVFNARIEVGYHDPKNDPDGIYALDAVLHGRVDVGISIVPTDIEAERAVANKLHFAGGAVEQWVALPRNIDQLANKTRHRLMAEYLVPIPVFEQGKERLAERFKGLTS